MVKKLYKYEYRSYWLWIVLIYGAILTSALIFRLTLGLVFQVPSISQVFLDDLLVWETAILFSAFAVYGITIAAGFTLIVVMPIVRFYKNLLSGEGYLTLSIPVSPANHLICKTVVAYTYFWGAILSLIASIAIILAGWDDSVEIFTAIGEGIKKCFTILGEQGAATIISFIAISIAAILAPAATMLLYYFCLSMGMLFGKYKIIGAVVFYIGLETALSVLGGSLQIVLMPIMTAIENEEAFILIFSLGYLIFLIAEICVFFGFSHHMFKHKVNI